MSDYVTNEQLRTWSNQISIEGRTEFSHSCMMPLIKEVIKSRALIEALKDNVWIMADKCGFEIVSEK